MEIPAKLEKKYVLLGNQAILQDNQAIHIGYGTDENFVMPMGVSIVSVLENNPAYSFIFHVMTEGLSEKSVGQLDALASTYPNCVICIHELQLQILDGLPVFSSLGRASYYRIFLEKLVPERLSRVLYLDGDIVCLGNLNELIKRDFSNAIVMVVKDKPVTAEKQERKFHLTDYFNSGMLYINLEQWKKQKVAEHLLEVFFAHKEELNHVDQDALNIVLQGYKRLLDERFNFIPGDDPIEEVPEGTVFLHYAGTKPWYYWLDFPLQRYFKKYYAVSPWKNQPMDRPRNYREMHYLSRFYRKQGQFGKSFYWVLKYLVTKVGTKIK
ncbi:glycosyltransferase family 8 protein [Acidaminococcus sp.]|uniref:glycosyltransferase family 8 protein n=1 Tax=Acidaminococcus sp. TaxID=1872103 RepID=UPI003D7D890B